MNEIGKRLANAGLFSDRKNRKRNRKKEKRILKRKKKSGEKSEKRGRLDGKCEKGIGEKRRKPERSQAASSNKFR